MGESIKKHKVNRLCERVYIVFENDGGSESIMAIYTFKYYAQRCVRNAKYREKRICERNKDRIKHTFYIKEYVVEEE